MNHNKFWDEKFAEFSQMVDDGLTSSEIARRLGITKNAVTGKAQRCGLRVGRSPARLAADLQRRREAFDLYCAGVKLKEIVLRTGIHRSSLMRSLQRTEAKLTESPAVRAVMALEPSDCRWPHGHPDEKGFRFCRARRLKFLPYCAEHAAIAYERPKEITI